MSSRESTYTLNEADSLGSYPLMIEDVEEVHEPRMSPSDPTMNCVNSTRCTFDLKLCELEERTASAVIGHESFKPSWRCLEASKMTHQATESRGLRKAQPELCRAFIGWGI